jgi:hypothetical protein
MPYNHVVSQSAIEPIDASNPANGINNILMQGGMDAGGAVGSALPASTGMPASEAKKILNHVIESGANAAKYKGVVEDLYNKLTNKNIQEKVGKLLQALEKNNDVRHQTKDPQTGFKDPTASQIAQQIIVEINQMEQEKDTTEKQASIHVFNLRESQEKKKKKKRDSRGNPFKVLMGKVGKLLDHGISKKDIIRFIMKEGHWNEETVEKAVNIVRDYNKKKHRNDKKLKETQEKEATTQKDTVVANNIFNLTKYAQSSLELDGVYGIQPEWSKRSTAELIMRASWLISLQNYDENTRQGDGKKAANKKGVSAQLKDIKKALADRGFDGEELFDNLQRKF